jgi:hypothetical protein
VAALLAVHAAGWLKGAGVGSGVGVAVGVPGIGVAVGKGVKVAVGDMDGVGVGVVSNARARETGMQMGLNDPLLADRLTWMPGTPTSMTERVPSEH